MGWDGRKVDREDTETANADFLGRYPEYEGTAVLDGLRDTEYFRLDEKKHIYLDYTGGGIYGDSQIRKHSSFLLGSVLGNPHSSNPTSAFTTEKVNDARERVLRYFNAPEDEFVLVFTANATQALKLVGEAYPFMEGDLLLLSFDNHNSVLGIREYDRARGAVTRYVPVVPPDLRLSPQLLEKNLEEGASCANRLFAYPAQSNFSGVQHPLEYIDMARSKGWDVLLDAAAFVPTNRLDIGRWKPDYTVLSFYKMFGYPTGVGALIARREALEKLHRPWFAGGTITVASVQADRHYLAPGAMGFEDGTLDYAMIPAVEAGLDLIESVGMDVIHTRVSCLADWLIRKLLALKHSNGRPVIRLYGPTEREARGGTVTINVYGSDDRVVDHSIVEYHANQWKISLRTGCFCNPGAGELALDLSKEEVTHCLESPDSRMTLEEFRQCIDGKSTGAVRVSMGIASNFRDVMTFYRFISGFREM